MGLSQFFSYILFILPIENIVVIMFLAMVCWTRISIGFRKTSKIKCKSFPSLWLNINVMLALSTFFIIIYYTILSRSSDTMNTMPFIRTIEHIRQQPELIREMIMNVFLFFPFGLTAPFALSSCLKNDEKGRKAVLITIISALLLSCSIEFIQYLYNFGNCELSDIVMNTLGAAIGSVSYLVSCRLSR